MNFFILFLFFLSLNVLAEGNPFADGYYQNNNPFGDGYVQDKSIFGFEK